MGILYRVWPLDDQMREWLASQDISAPSGQSRWPTSAEIRDVLRDLRHFRVSYTENGRGAPWDADIQSFHAEDLRTLLHAQPEEGNDEVTKFGFEKGEPLLIVAILRALSARTGPLALMADVGGPPLVISWGAPFRELVSEFCDFDELSKVWSALESSAPGAKQLQ